MILVAGLGNPGDRYAATRHNVGFRVVEALLDRVPGGPPWRQKFSGQIALVDMAGDRVLLLKPETYMNRSGESVGPAASFYKIPPAATLIVHDEIDLPFGQIRLKMGGGEAGHNGLRSVTQHFGTRDYPRLRFGVGKPPPEFRGDGADFVLQGFASAERAQLDELVEQAARAVALFVERGLQEAMNSTNRRTNN